MLDGLCRVRLDRHWAFLSVQSSACIASLDLLTAWQREDEAVIAGTALCARKTATFIAEVIEDYIRDKVVDTASKGEASRAAEKVGNMVSGNDLLTAAAAGGVPRTVAGHPPSWPR